ncbi:Emb [Columba guinea]|nr:Emb [Columba guinea]
MPTNEAMPIWRMGLSIHNAIYILSSFSDTQSMQSDKESSDLEDLERERLQRGCAAIAEPELWIIYSKKHSPCLLITVLMTATEIGVPDLMPFCSCLKIQLIMVSSSKACLSNPAMTTQDASQPQANSLTKMQAGLNESSEPMTTTYTVNWQSQGSPSDHLTLGHDASTHALLGPGVTTQVLKQAGQLDVSNITTLKYEIRLPGLHGLPLAKRISLDRAAEIQLSCRLKSKYSYLKILQVTWKKGSEIIPHNKTENGWSIQLIISDVSKLGSYSCILKGQQEMRATFHLQGKALYFSVLQLGFVQQDIWSYNLRRLSSPKIEAKEKPVISYKGDMTILICKISEYTPVAWTWYRTNRSEQIAINDSVLADKYVIDRVFANVTRLKILKLTEEDSGLYLCEAAFKLGKSRGKLQLKVLTYAVPLKPFVAVVAEVATLVTIIFLYEIYSKKKEGAKHKKEFDQIEQLRGFEIFSHMCFVYINMYFSPLHVVKALAVLPNQKKTMVQKAVVLGREELNPFPKKDYILSEFIEEGCKCSTSGECDSTKDKKQGIIDLFPKEYEWQVNSVMLIHHSMEKPCCEPISQQTGRLKLLSAEGVTPVRAVVYVVVEAMVLDAEEALEEHGSTVTASGTQLQWAGQSEASEENPCPICLRKVTTQPARPCVSVASALAASSSGL